MQTVQPLTLADAVLPRLEGSGALLRWAREALLLAAGAAFVALCAQIALRLPWTTVPVTGQTFAVLVAGGALGAWRGAGALSLYMVVGMLGLPVFAPATGVTSGEWDLHFLLPWRGTEALVWNISSGGYIVGFVLAAWLVGFLAERGLDRGAWVHLAMLAGNALIYVPGLLWLAYLIETDWLVPGAGRPLGEFIAGSGTLDKTLRGGLYPFIVGDLMKLLLAASVLPTAWLVVERVRGSGRWRR